MQSDSWIRDGANGVAVLLLAVLSSGCAADRQHDYDAFERKLPQTEAALMAAGDADSLAAAAEISAFKDGPVQQLALLERARSLAPERPDLLWLTIRACSRLPDCDPTPLAKTLHALDPGNAAAWSPLIDDATKRKDAEALRAYLTAAGESQRFDIYWTTSTARLTNALLKVNANQARAALTNLIGIEAAISIPAFRNFTSPCRGDALQDPDHLRTCRGIAAALRAGDTYIAELLGTGMAKRLWPEGSAEYAAAVEAQHAARYRMQTAGKLAPVSLRDERDASEFLSLMGNHRTEQALDEAVISRAGVSIVSPPNWRDTTPGES